VVMGSLFCTKNLRIGSDSIQFWIRKTALLAPRRPFRTLASDGFAAVGS
jgi:hypothetical protein